MCRLSIRRSGRSIGGHAGHRTRPVVAGPVAGAGWLGTRLCAGTLVAIVVGLGPAEFAAAADAGMNAGVSGPGRVHLVAGTDHRGGPDAVDAPTITFAGSVLAPVACSSRPDLSDLTVPTGTRVVLANFTGATATLDIDAGPAAVLADGAAVSVTFGAGGHRVRMMPNCIGTLTVESATITAVRPGSAPTGAEVDADLPETSEPYPDSGGPAIGSAAGGSGGSRPAGYQPRATDPDPAAVTGEAAVRSMGDAAGQRGNRLLAVIATICVFGVTTAIIRVIVAQRASGT
jgi:hypothetical protein